LRGGNKAKIAGGTNGYIKNRFLERNGSNAGTSASKPTGTTLKGTI